MSNARNIASIAGEDVLNANNEIVPVYACRAWVNFNGTLDENENIDGSLTTGENVYIRNDGNVSSVYFNGTGDYTINFEIPMPDANYSFQGMAAGIADNYEAYITQFFSTAPTTTALRIEVIRPNRAIVNSIRISIAIFR